MSKHSNVTLGARHAAHNYEYANAAARLAATGFVAADIHKLAIQTDDNTIWQLTAITPVWKQVDAGGGGGDVTAIHDNVAAEISLIAEKVAPTAADLIIIEDSAAANAKKKVQVGNLPAGAPGPHTHVEADITDLNHTDGAAIHDNVSSEISAITLKAAPVSADHILIEDSAAANAKRRITVGSLPGGGGGAAALRMRFGFEGAVATADENLWEVMTSLVYLGSATEPAISTVKYLITDQGTVGGQARLVDVTNGLVIASVAIVNTDYAIVSLGAVSNVPAGEAVLEVQLNANVGGELRLKGGVIH